MTAESAELEIEDDDESGVPETDAQDAERLLDMAQFALAEARNDPVAFFNLCMRAELTQEPVTVAPHQEVLLDFVMSHERCVVVLPIGTAKTWSMAGLSLYFLGRDPTVRGAVVSATQLQATKVVGMVRDYIESNSMLHAVFGLTRNERDQWTQTAITVTRPPGIRDPSLVAVGVDGAIAGARLSWIIVDDILDRENTATKEQRDKVCDWFDSIVLARLDPRGGRVVVTNTAWHPNDLVHRLEKKGWAVLRMGIDGSIYIRDDVERIASGLPPWDTDRLRPADPNDLVNNLQCRLTAHDPDPTNSIPLWPERMGHDQIEKARREHTPARYNQLFMGICRDDETSRCKQEWIDACMKRARDMGVTGLVSQYTGKNLTFTGVDLAISPGEESDDTAFVTIEILPKGYRRILDIDVGKFDGPTTVKKLFEKHERYNSVIRVESNAAQEFLRQFALDRDRSLPIKPHVTGRNKAHPEHGVEAIFVEVFNGAWLFPNNSRGVCHKNVQRLIDAMLYYEPARHTEDTLMAMWFAIAMAREWGAAGGREPEEQESRTPLGIGIMSR